MHKLKSTKVTALVLGLALCLVTMPAIAAPQGRASAVTEPETTVSTDDSTSPTEVRKKGRELANDMRAQHQANTTKTAEQKQKTCEAHKQGLTKKFERITANSEKIKTHIDDVFTKVQAFQTENNLSVSNYADLVTAATAAQTAAAESITSLKEVTPSVDCNSTSVAADVATFKVAGQDTRDTLKEYRTAVKAIVQALHKAKTAETSEGSND